MLVRDDWEQAARAIYAPSGVAIGVYITTPMTALRQSCVLQSEGEAWARVVEILWCMSLNTGDEEKRWSRCTCRRCAWSEWASVTDLALHASP